MIFTHRHYRDLKPDYASGVIESDMPLFLLQAWPVADAKDLSASQVRLCGAQISKGSVITLLTPCPSLVWFIILMKSTRWLFEALLIGCRVSLSAFACRTAATVQTTKKRNKGNPYGGVMSSRLRARRTPFWCAKRAVASHDPATAAAEVERERYGAARQWVKTLREGFCKVKRDRGQWNRYSEGGGGGRTKKKSDADREIKRGGAERGSKKRGEGRKAMCQHWVPERCKSGREETFHSSPLPVFPPPPSPPLFSQS